MHPPQSSLVLGYHGDRTLRDVYFLVICSVFTLTSVSFPPMVRQVNTFLKPDTGFYNNAGITKTDVKKAHFTILEPWSCYEPRNILGK